MSRIIKVIKCIRLFLIVLIITAISYKAYAIYADHVEQEQINLDAKSYFFVELLKDDYVYFDERKLQIQLAYIYIETEKEYTVEELKDSYFEKDDLFYDYMDTALKCGFFPKGFENSIDYIAKEEWGRLFVDLSQERQEHVGKIYREEQKLVTDYYGDDRIKLCKLTYEQQMEFYKLSKDSSYVLDDKLMETNEPFGGSQKYEEHLVITKIDGDTITLEQKKYDWTIRYVGTYQKENDFEVGDKVYVEFYFFSSEGSGFGYDYKYYNIQFEKMEKE